MPELPPWRRQLKIASVGVDSISLDCETVLPSLRPDEHGREGKTKVIMTRGRVGMCMPALGGLVLGYSVSFLGQNAKLGTIRGIVDLSISRRLWPCLELS
jgi:hypothetical protein